MAIWRCPIAPFHTKWAFFKIFNLKQRQLPIFFPPITMKKMGNWRCFKFKIWKKPIWCEMAQIGQRQIAIYVFSAVYVKGVQSFCQEGHMWWDEHIIVSLLVLSIVSTILGAGSIYCHSIHYESSHGPVKIWRRAHLAQGPDFGHAWFMCYCFKFFDLSPHCPCDWVKESNNQNLN